MADAVAGSEDEEDGGGGGGGHFGRVWERFVGEIIEGAEGKRIVRTWWRAKKGAQECAREIEQRGNWYGWSIELDSKSGKL